LYMQWGLRLETPGVHALTIQRLLSARWLIPQGDGIGIEDDITKLVQDLLTKRNATVSKIEEHQREVAAIRHRKMPALSAGSSDAEEESSAGPSRSPTREELSTAPDDSEAQTVDTVQVNGRASPSSTSTSGNRGHKRRAQDFPSRFVHASAYGYTFCHMRAPKHCAARAPPVGGGSHLSGSARICRVVFSLRKHTARAGNEMLILFMPRRILYFVRCADLFGWRPPSHADAAKQSGTPKSREHTRGTLPTLARRNGAFAFVNRMEDAVV
jgi:hypothetical protein